MVRGLTGSRSHGVAGAFVFSQLFLAFPWFSLLFRACWFSCLLITFLWFSLLFLPFLWCVGLETGAGRRAYGAWSDG